MITRETINKELGEIKYFNSRREMFDKAFDSVGKNTVLAAIGKYNTTICNASPKLYEVYVTLFIEGCTMRKLLRSFATHPNTSTSSKEYLWTTFSKN